MELKPGYKQTEVGVIPEDWEIHKSSDLCERIMVGIVIRPSQYYTRDGVPALRSANIREDGINDIDLVFISEDSNQLLAKSQVREGDVLTVRTGYPGTSAVAEAKHSGSNCIDILITRPSSRILPQWLCLWINSPFGKEQVLRNQGGLAQKHFNVSDMRNLVVVLPQPIEQREISGAMCDVDALISYLEKLIEKKRDIKQAAMQELLTGKRRLPGFEGKWETIRLGDHVKYLRNGTNSRAELRADGRVKYLHYGDVHASSRSFASPHDLPSLPVSKAVGLDRLKDGDLIFADASEDVTGVSKSVEICDSRDSELVSGLHTIAARFEKSVLADGFKGFLQYVPSFSEHLRRLAAGTKVYATNRAHISSAEVQLPPVSEQRAIAGVLSEMDAELAALEARRDKTRDLKQGMMQELLTGRIRLV